MGRLRGKARYRKLRNRQERKVEGESKRKVR